jgi:hypothetical protein
MIPGRRSLRGPGNPEARDRLDWVGGAEPFACFIAARTKQGLGQKLRALLAIRGVRLHQTGDLEARVRVNDTAIAAVLALIGGHRRKLEKVSVDPVNPSDPMCPVLGEFRDRFDFLLCRCDYEQYRDGFTGSV